jgi:heme iron utilization protein
MPATDRRVAVGPGASRPVGLYCGMTILGSGGGDDPSCGARTLIRRRGHAALATSLDGRPYASLVAVCCDTAGNPLMLLSDLAQHTRNIRGDSRVSLLFEDGGFDADPLAGPRLSLVGQAEPIEDGAAHARFVARHPSAARYAGFADFRLYRMTAERGHFVAGFGRIDWIDGAALRLTGEFGALAEAEPDIIAHMNDDHEAVVALYAERLLHRGGDGWRLTGIDPEGIDLRRGSEIARLDFAGSVHDPATARAVLIALADSARAPSPMI